MDAAIRAVKLGSALSINSAARDHGIPPTTLKDRLSGRVNPGSKPGPLPYLNNDEETELEAYLVQSCKVGYGKTLRQVKSIVENVATDKGILRSSHISDGWWRRFRERHPKLTLRCGERRGKSSKRNSTSASPVTSLDNPSSVDGATAHNSSIVDGATAHNS